MKKFLKNQKGQGIMEYVILSSLVGIICIAAVKSFGSTVVDRIKVMETQVTKNLKPASGFNNNNQ